LHRLIAPAFAGAFVHVHPQRVMDSTHFRILVKIVDIGYCESLGTVASETLITGDDFDALY
jgi:hypothetical protein